MTIVDEVNFIRKRRSIMLSFYLDQGMLWSKALAKVDDMYPWPKEKPELTRLEYLLEAYIYKDDIEHEKTLPPIRKWWRNLIH